MKFEDRFLLEEVVKWIANSPVDFYRAADGSRTVVGYMTDETRNLSTKPNPMELVPIGEAEESCAKANIDPKDIKK